MKITSLTRAGRPAAIGALVSIDDDSRDAILAYFPGLPDYITSEVAR